MPRYDPKMKPEGCFKITCRAHGTMYSIYYGRMALFSRDGASSRAHEFMQTHCRYAPDCSLDIKVTEEKIEQSES
jgi:hypothetical protein